MVINFENLKYTDKYTDKWKKFECLYAYRQLDSLFLDSGIFEYRIELLAKKNIWVSMWVAAHHDWWLRYGYLDHWGVAVAVFFAPLFLVERKILIFDLLLYLVAQVGLDLESYPLWFGSI